MGIPQHVTYNLSRFLWSVMNGGIMNSPDPTMKMGATYGAWKDIARQTQH
jgi:hypothetical protein